MGPILNKSIIGGILFLSLGCASKVEIPISHVGVVKSHDQVNPLVLKPGEHLVNFDSEVIIYDIKPVTLDMDFDFLFADSSEGKMVMVMEFTPIADSLSIFYKIYQSNYVTPVIDQGTRKVVRNLLFNYKPNDLSKNELKHKILEAITVKHPILNFIEINRVDIIELRY